MKTIKSYCIHTFLLIGIFLTSLCSASGVSPEIILVGSTPGDELIKSLLTIPSTTKVDFIRWDLKLTDAGANQNSFVLNIAFGEGQPNTSGFKKDGEKRLF